MIIVPSIIAKDFLDVEYRIRQVHGTGSPATGTGSPARGGASWVHVDVVDGEFATPASWPYTGDNVDDEIKLMNDIVPGGPSIGLHLMVSDPQEYLDAWIDTPVKRILVQYESPEHIQNALAVLDMSKIESGVVLALDTPVDVLSELPEKIKFVQLMSIGKIGHYGEQFQDEVYDKIRALKKLNNGIKISVDGGIKEEHLLALKEAGADQVVMGSAIFDSPDPGAELERLANLINKQ